MIRKTLEQMNLDGLDAVVERLKVSLPSCKDTENAILNAVLKGLQSEDPADAIQNAPSWWHRVAKCNITSDCRHEQVQKKHQEAVVRRKQRDSRTPLDELEYNEITARVEEARRRLPDEFAVIVALALQDYTFGEIADYLGVTHQKARALWYEAVALLRESLRSYFEDEIVV